MSDEFLKIIILLLAIFISILLLSMIFFMFSYGVIVGFLTILSNMDIISIEMVSSKISATLTVFTIIIFGLILYQSLYG